MAQSRSTDLESLNPTINGYRKIRKVGEGAFGETYHVTKNGKDYALKILKSFQMTETVVHEAVREITILRSLKHVNVVSYVDSFRDGLNEVNIVMEYCDVGNLGMLIDSRDPSVVDERFITAAMTQLCCGMEYIHSKKVIHRDIKPTNIFLQAEGFIKIGDFGLSKTLQSSRYANSVCGTIGYISPECVLGLPYNCQSDMWAIGRVLFDLCNLGAKEWHPARITIPQRYSNDLRTILQWLLSPNPRHRLPAAKAKAMFSNLHSTLRSSRRGASAGDRESEPANDPGAVVLTEPANDTGAVVLTEPANDPGAVVPTEPANDTGAVVLTAISAIAATVGIAAAVFI